VQRNLQPNGGKRTARRDTGLIDHIPDAWRELQTNQVEEAEINSE
jgi:hypothetical protein